MTTTTTTQPAPANTALALSGTFHDVATVGAALERAARQAHLVSPATSCGCLPEGFDLVMSTVKIDAAGETYSVAGGDDDSGGGGGKRGLSKVALDRIALAAGVSWDPVASRRLDDGRDPRYCAWLAVGRVKSLDGTEIVLQASKEIDLRDGSPQVDGLWARYKTKLARWEREGKKGWQPRSPEGQLREQRLHLLSMCETKARLRAIRSLGVRTAYSADELKKPFVIARLAFTGRSEDPELRRTFAVMAAQNALASSRALYGPPRAPLLPAGHAIPQLPAPTPAPLVGTVVDQDDDPPLEVVVVPSEPAAVPSDVEERVADDGEAAHTTTAVPPRPAQTERSGFVIPGGRSRGTPIEQSSDGDLAYWGNRIEDDLAAGKGKPQFAARDRQLVVAIRAEQGRRAVGGGLDDGDDRAGQGDDDIPF